jgi:hypothetical protein
VVMRAFCAKVSGRVVEASSLGCSDVTSIAGADAAAGGAAKGLAPEDGANGFAGAALPELEEKGFENGFAGAVELALGFTPNSDSPILGCGFSSSTLTSFLSVFAPDLADAPFATRTPRMLLTLPSFRLHALRRQLQM